jgi:hypothetical protein
MGRCRSAYHPLCTLQTHRAVPFQGGVRWSYRSGKLDGFWRPWRLPKSGKPSLMDANRHTQDGEYAKARERRRQYRELLCRLKERMFKDKANR